MSIATYAARMSVPKPHIAAQAGEIADAVLLPGDSLTESALRTIAAAQ